MGNSYKNCKIQDNTAELIYENGSLFVTIFENNIVHVAQKTGIESVAIEESFIPKAATPDVTSKDTSDAKGTAAEAGVSDAAVKAVIRARDITVYVKDNEKLDIYYKGKLVLSDYEKARKKSEKNPYEDLAIAELEGHTVGKDEEKTDSVTIIKKLGKDDAIYGLGDKPGCLNKRGYSYVNWNTDDPAPHVDSFKSLYKSIPFLSCWAMNIAMEFLRIIPTRQPLISVMKTQITISSSMRRASWTTILCREMIWQRW